MGRSGKGISGGGKSMRKGLEIGETGCAFKNLKKPL